MAGGQGGRGCVGVREERGEHGRATLEQGAPRSARCSPTSSSANVTPNSIKRDVASGHRHINHDATSGALLELLHRRRLRTILLRHAHHDAITSSPREQQRYIWGLVRAALPTAFAHVPPRKTRGCDDARCLNVVVGVEDRAGSRQQSAAVSRPFLQR